MPAAGSAVARLLFLLFWSASQARPDIWGEVHKPVIGTKHFNQEGKNNGGQAALHGGTVRELLQAETFVDLNFSLARSSLEERLATKPYKDIMEITHLDECVAYFEEIFPADCSGDITKADIRACCRAGVAFLDDGLCMCEGQVARGMLQQPGLLASSPLCGIQFPIPDDIAHFVADPGSSKPAAKMCKRHKKSSIQGRLSPRFLGLSPAALESALPGELPKFDDLYRHPPRGGFGVNYEVVTVGRPKASVIVNDRSREMDFDALVVYPVDWSLRSGEGRPRKVSSGGPFPVLAFSPGYLIHPHNHFRTFYELASHGVIVVAQYSTVGVSSGVDEGVMDAWVDDIVYGLVHVVEAGKTAGSILEGGVDQSRLAIGGHSMGGALSLPATVLANEEYGMGVGASIHVSPACKMRAGQCDMSTEAARKLKGVAALFIAGDEDGIEAWQFADFFRSQVPDSSEAELVLIEGASHCLWEDDPEVWTFVVECGKGSKSPFDAIYEMQEAMIRFLGEQGYISQA